MNAPKPMTLEELAADEDRKYAAKRDSIRKVGDIAQSVGWRAATTRGALRMELDHAITRHDNGKRVIAVMDWFAHWRKELRKFMHELDDLGLDDSDHSTFVEAVMQGYADGIADATKPDPEEDEAAAWRGR